MAEDDCYFSDKHGNIILYEHISEELWAQIFGNPDLPKQYAEQERVARLGVGPMQIVDRDPGPQQPHTLPPLDHGDAPLLDASEA